ncbi:MAG: hypothetical protein LUH14_12895 [Clostridiaceae bacterium]|nr:hypothetical protein [Clostridiaceae bacterium]
MTLLTAVIAAIISTVIWYQKDAGNQMKTGTLALVYWGASLMWFVDAVFEYAELGVAYFTPEPADMLNDFFLGISVVAFGMLIWLAMVLIRDPKGVVRRALAKR